MTKFRMSVLILAVLTALILTGCVDDAIQDSSVPEALQTFGVAVNPSAEPSFGETMPEVSKAPVVENNDAPEGEAVISQGNTQSQPTEPEEDEPEEAEPTPTKKPSSSSSTPKPTPSDDGQPTIAPPDAASTATPDQVKNYIGKSIKDLIADLGYPTRSDYEPVDENDPEAGAIGTLYFDGFVATTQQTSEGEIVTSVTEGSGSSSDTAPSAEPQTSEEPDASPEPETSAEPSTSAEPETSAEPSGNSDSE